MTAIQSIIHNAPVVKAVVGLNSLALIAVARLAWTWFEPSSRRRLALGRHW